MKFIVLFLFLILSSNSFAAGCNASGCTGKPSELFSNYYLTSFADGRVYLHMKDNISKQNMDCSLAEGVYATLMSNHPLFKEIYSSLLSATAMDRQVHMRIKNGSSNCEVAYVRLYM